MTPTRSALILLTLCRFAAVSRPAAWLLVPYLAWVSYAAYLNAATWWLNG
ncbi:tryptophan-rich sensory protein [Halomonas sp.]